MIFIISHPLLIPAWGSKAVGESEAWRHRRAAKWREERRTSRNALSVSLLLCVVDLLLLIPVMGYNSLSKKQKGVLPMPTWMIYGANGYMGELIAREVK